MAGANQVTSTVSTAAAAPTTQPSFNVGMIAGYHTHYGDRQRTYQAANWSTAMTGDGFLTTEPLYRDAQAYFSQPQAPQSLVIGRRANPTTQVVNLVCTDSTAGDQYSLSVIGSDDVAHTITFPSTGTPNTDATTLASYFAAIGGPVTHTGTGPNTVTFTGTATANMTLLIVMQLGGAVGTATFNWYLNGVLQAANVVTAATVVLTGGLTANFAVGTYVANDTYSVTAIINVGVVSHTTATVTFTQSSGKLNDFLNWQSGAVQNIQLTDASTDPGVTADLQAILNQNTLSFYGVALDSNSKAEVISAIAWCQGLGNGAQGKFFFGNNSDAACVNVPAVSTTDVFSTAQTNGYHKAFLCYSGSELLSMIGVSMMSYALGQASGRYTLNGKGAPGCIADRDASLSASQWAALNPYAAGTVNVGNVPLGGKMGNYYALNNGAPVVQPGCTPAGDWVDFIIWEDVIASKVQTSVYAAKNAGAKLPYDNNGLTTLYGAIYQPLYLDSQGLLPAILPGSIVINMPTLAQISQASQLARDVPNANWSATYDGAIQTVEAGGTVLL